MIETPIKSDALDYEDIISRIQGIFNQSTPLEQKQFLKILEELSDKGYSETLDTIYLVDFKEVPVSIDRFLTDPQYLGGSNDCGKQIYPGWWDVYHDVFDDSKNIYEVVLSGATRIGKSSTAVSCICYMTYLLMCYRNPQKYFGLKEVSRATIAFANLTKELALSVAFREYNDTLKESSWFNNHGKFTNSDTKPVFIPEGNKIEIIAASSGSMLLGKQLWCCLVGNTNIITKQGIMSLQELCGNYIEVLQYNYYSNSYEYAKAPVVRTKHVTDTIRIELEDGSIFEGTPEHRVMLIDGTYKRLDELTETDEVLSVYGAVVSVIISKIEKVHYDKPIPVYDVVNAGSLHNFIIHTDKGNVVAHNCLMDEVNFAKANIKDIDKAKSDIKQMYDTANARITGTFKLNGRIYGKMFTCSSKNTDNDYLSGHIEKQLDAGNKHMYLFDKPQWEVLPSYRFGKERFYITVGDRYKKGFVVSDENADEAHLQEYRNEGYQVLEVPADYKPNFRADYDIALRDIAGISVVGAMGFITQEMITPNISDTRQNPFFEDYYEIGVQDADTLERHFHPEVVPQELKRLSMNIHIDFAEVSDHIGIAGGVRDGDKNVIDPLTQKTITMPYFREIFQVAIGAPRGDRMSFQKVINFIVWLKKNGFNVGIVSTDQYQSSYVRENLTQQGFICEKVSVDKSADPYIGLRNLLQDQRIDLIKHDLQEVELINLQRVNGIINHPPQSNSTTALPCLANGYNSKGIGKDCADALCGCMTTLIAHAQVVKPHTKPVLNAIASVNGPRNYGYNRNGNNRYIPGFGNQYRRL